MSNAQLIEPLDGTVITQGRSSLDVSPKLVELVYELLDAHDDTARISDEHVGADCWAAHLEYLRQLQRVGREVLAESAV